MSRIASGWMAGALVAIAGAAIAQVPYGWEPPKDQPATAGKAVLCASDEGQRMSCAVPADWKGAQLLQQTSRTACTRGTTWGFDGHDVWVRAGCAGVFGPGDYRDAQP